jgi:hypothetical protein
MPLDSRTVEDHESLCPAAYPIGEGKAGSGVLCRITGRVVATGTDPSSLRSFCWCPRPSVEDVTADGQPVRHGYQNCPPWRHNRNRELREKAEFPEGTPERVKDAMLPQYVTRQ